MIVEIISVLIFLIKSLWMPFFPSTLIQFPHGFVLCLLFIHWISFSSPLCNACVIFHEYNLLIGLCHRPQFVEKLQFMKWSELWWDKSLLFVSLLFIKKILYICSKFETQGMEFKYALVIDAIQKSWEISLLCSGQRWPAMGDWCVHLWFRSCCWYVLLQKGCS